MTRPIARIGAIYRKELLEILRDRRTLIAMIVIPVVLYPLLMLGFLRAAESEQERLKAEKFTVEVNDEPTAAQLNEILIAAQALDADPPEKRASWDIQVGHTPPAALGDSVQLHVGLTVEPKPAPLPTHRTVEITYTEIDIHSRTAMTELSKLFEIYSSATTREALGNFLAERAPGAAVRDDVTLILNPVEVRSVSAATENQRGGWAMGQIIPIILVLMTITGAIYPAIDLTAGERERGTLETLMAAPVPVIYLIIGKFLVVATVALITAFLNLGSVGATMHFGGITQILTQEKAVQFPLFVLPIILVCMIPFALLFSAIMVAVCSFARTFKEAQNYMMPVIIAAMIPAFAAALPSMELSGATLVMPVANMVLLTRELFQQTFTWSQVGIVLLSTTLYAAAAVAVAAKLFGQEVVLFADAGSYKTLLRRRHFKAVPLPSASQALLLAALLFPAAFYAQSLLNIKSPGEFIRSMFHLAGFEFAGLFVLLPLALAVYLRINVRNTFRLNLPPLRGWLAALLIGASSWALGQEFAVFQQRILPMSEAMRKMGEATQSLLSGVPLSTVVLLFAVVPALCEEFFFRGFVLSGLSSGLPKWRAIITAAAIFGVYHFIIDRVPLTATLGIVLGYMCWQARSILPAILVHAMNNGAAMVIGALPAAQRLLRIDTIAEGQHLPARILVPAIILFAAGLALVASIRHREPQGGAFPVLRS